ncbi:ABC transporter ATP-binding protein [Dermatophilus congolensis]|uniref:ATP-binding cassette domain-containing protein n=1 Tax=Dermatophilus congolensis TaxID=1863 RepID=UPI001AAEEC9F|nr:ABC transporter ATP-binding protein [Dermatophilus congolensis]MBO3143681.1 ABC transporter ATP-binding protein [Dermatophilus congolensis]MBO3152672.1 ABC transporter ATP-binding protein [Dermatophilus congolensis]MBO3160318.1 ABC transporter ATP-binding protein [Dermatophilus congolensis]MBO3163956.1 ABC transporter ATP-binding protein [Dermatophilus congolensis]MBO3177502.1 ABC transporter ATP-binding protein [Dermatophilus congolensis]
MSNNPLASITPRAQHTRLPVLECTELTAGYTPETDIISGINLQLARGKLTGIIGESGSGKSTLLNALLGFTHDGLRIRSGTVSYDGADITHVRWSQRRRLLGPELSIVFQRPSASFDPLMRIGTQFCESIRLHTPKASRRACWAAGRGMLQRLRFEDPERVMRAYPHQLSGGMTQRAAIAMSLLSEPRVLLADEPTSAVDVRSQQEVIELLGDIATEFGTAIVFVSHQIKLVRRLVTELHVLAHGRVVESGPTEQLFQAPTHEVTRRLLEATPVLNRGLRA